MYKVIYFAHTNKGGKMDIENCDECKDAKYGIAYIDPKTGILCCKIATNMKLPKGKKILAPQICTKCGTTTWKTIDNKK